MAGRAVHITDPTKVRTAARPVPAALAVRVRPERRRCWKLPRRLATGPKGRTYNSQESRGAVASLLVPLPAEAAHQRHGAYGQSYSSDRQGGAMAGPNGATASRQPSQLRCSSGRLPAANPTPANARAER